MRTVFEQPALHECVVHAVRLSFELHEPAVMHDAVDDRGRHLVVPEDRSPAGELQVRRDHHRLALVGVGEDLEHEPRPVGIERQEAQLVDDEQGRAADLRGLAVEPSLVAGAAKAHHERGGGEEAGLQAPVAGQLAQGARHVGLARADVAHEREVLPALEERERKQVLPAEAVGPRDRGPVVPVEGLGRRQPAAPEQLGAPRGVPAVALRLEVARQVLDLLCFVKPRFRKRALLSFGFRHESFSGSGAGTPLYS